jgi:uncharacterized protein YjbJ (UPF0337 family)
LHLQEARVQQRAKGVSMNKDEIKGKAEKAKGYVKDKVGEITNNPDLEAEGEAERAGGAAREVYGTAKRKVNEAAEEVRDRTS